MLPEAEVNRQDAKAREILKEIHSYDDDLV
jgi:hypothetical protein